MVESTNSVLKVHYTHSEKIKKEESQPKNTWVLSLMEGLKLFTSITITRKHSPFF
jgi:hypothetical protein